MHFLRSPITWALLGLGIWLNCEYNYRYMQVNGADAVTTPMLFQQALIGSVALVGIVCGLALLRGEKFELYNQGDFEVGKTNKAGLIICCVLFIGFVFNFVLNKDLLFITQGGMYASEGRFTVTPAYTWQGEPRPKDPGQALIEAGGAVGGQIRSDQSAYPVPMQGQRFYPQPPRGQRRARTQIYYDGQLR